VNGLGFAVGLSDSNGGFTIEPGYGAELRDMGVADLDGDGRLDVAATLFNGVVFFYGRDPLASTVGVPNPPVQEGPRGTQILGVFPNPSRSGLHVRFRAAGLGPVALNLFDTSGRKLRTLHRSVVGAPGLETAVSIGDLGLAPGLYFLRLTSASGADTRRVVIVR
jgi:hypothetical protein